MDKRKRYFLGVCFKYIGLCWLAGLVVLSIFYVVVGSIPVSNIGLLKVFSAMTVIAGLIGAIQGMEAAGSAADVAVEKPNR